MLLQQVCSSTLESVWGLVTKFITSGLPMPKEFARFPEPFPCLQVEVGYDILYARVQFDHSGNRWVAVFGGLGLL